jgi:hypothetical protein
MEIVIIVITTSNLWTLPTLFYLGTDLSASFLDIFRVKYNY